MMWFECNYETETTENLILKALRLAKKQNSYLSFMYFYESWKLREAMRDYEPMAFLGTVSVEFY